MKNFHVDSSFSEIWLHCACGWGHQAGFDPDLESLLTIAGGHQDECEYKSEEQ